MNDSALVELINEKVRNNRNVSILKHSAFRGINALQYKGFVWERVLGKFWGGGCHSTHYRITHNGKSIKFHGENDYVNSLKMFYRIITTK